MTQPIIIDITLIAVFALCVIIGARRGLFKAIAGIAGAIGGLIAALKLSPMLTPIIAKAITPVFSGVVRRTAEGIGLSDALGAVVSPQTEQGLRDILSTLKIPHGSLDSIVSTANQSGDKIALTAGSALAEQFAPMIAFIVIFIVAEIVISLLLPLLGSNLPLIKTANSLIGGVLGAVMGMLIVIALCLGARSYAPKDVDGLISISSIEQSKICGFILKILN